MASNLTLAQQKLVRTPAFKAWFGDWENDPENASKVVDENGEPLVVWHGGNENITEFMPYSIDYYYENGENKHENIFRGNKTLNEFKKISKEKGWRFVEPNFWFSKNNAYSNAKVQHQCFLKIINLKEQNDDISTRINEKESKLDNFGIKVIWSDDNEQYYCVFNSNQIKLADGTNTTFDSTSDDIRYKDGGSLSKTPALKKEIIYESKVNEPKSSSTKEKAYSIIFSDKVIRSINSILEKHNQKSKKKIPLSTAKAVVRRGMGAYSSTHRPTITGGQPNSRVAWGLARLNAFIYKIEKGYSKSKKYSQDDDLIKELGFKVEKYVDGGNVQSDGYCVPMGSALELGIECNNKQHDMIAMCDCGQRFTYQKAKKNMTWQCPACKGMKYVSLF